MKNILKSLKLSKLLKSGDLQFLNTTYIKSSLIIISTPFHITSFLLGVNSIGILESTMIPFEVSLPKLAVRSMFLYNSYVSGLLLSKYLQSIERNASKIVKIFIPTLFSFCITQYLFSNMLYTNEAFLFAYFIPIALQYINIHSIQYSAVLAFLSFISVICLYFFSIKLKRNNKVIFTIVNDIHRIDGLLTIEKFFKDDHVLLEQEFSKLYINDEISDMINKIYN